MNPNNELLQAAKALLRYVEQNECPHEETHRGGAIWTICDACGRKWADGDGGFKPYQEPEAITDARTAIASAEASASQPAPDEQREKAIGHSLHEPVLYHLDDGKVAQAVRIGPSTIPGSSQLVVDLMSGDGPSVVGKPEWFGAGYVAAYGGLVPECAEEGTAPGQWSFGVRKLPQYLPPPAPAVLYSCPACGAEMDSSRCWCCGWSNK